MRNFLTLALAGALILAQTAAAAYTPNPITAGSAKQRVESARINCDSSSAIVSQSSTWVSSVGNVSSGQCTVTFVTGVFSATPWCIAGVVQGACGLNSCNFTYGASSATSFTSKVTADDGTTNSTSYDYWLTCYGAR